MAKGAKRNGGAVLFEVETPIGFSVRCTAAYGNFIVSDKHPAIAGRADEIEKALRDPDQIRRSRKAGDVFLFYRGGPPRWICAVARRQNDKGFLVTAYPTDAIKAGEEIWKKSK